MNRLNINWSEININENVSLTLIINNTTAIILFFNYIGKFCYLEIILVFLSLKRKGGTEIIVIDYY